MGTTWLFTNQYQSPLAKDTSPVAILPFLSGCAGAIVLPVNDTRISILEIMIEDGY